LAKIVHPSFAFHFGAAGPLFVDFVKENADKKAACRPWGGILISSASRLGAVEQNPEECAHERFGAF
jgi:hypothetical protein